MPLGKPPFSVSLPVCHLQHGGLFILVTAVSPAANHLSAFQPCTSEEFKQKTQKAYCKTLLYRNTLKPEQHLRGQYCVSRPSLRQTSWRQQHVEEEAFSPGREENREETGTSIAFKGMPPMACFLQRDPTTERFQNLPQNGVSSWTPRI